MKRKIWRRTWGIMASVGLLCISSGMQPVYGAEDGSWQIAADGKRWMYYYAPDEMAKDQWIEEDGKEYYVDSAGYMKTGWVTDKRDGNRYYLGEDGTRVFNQFTPDDSYIGPEGTALTGYDTYRKAIRQKLQSIMKSKEFKNQPDEMQPGFLLSDLNGDGYRDVVVMNRNINPDRLVFAAVWNPDEESLMASAEADSEGDQVMRLSYNEEYQTVWLTIKEKDGSSISGFALKSGGSVFEQAWNFKVKTNDWGDPVYIANEAAVDSDNWEKSLKQAEEGTGISMESQIVQLNQDNIISNINRIPGLEELSLWN